MVTAEAYYGYGDYAKAADLFRAALGKQGVDKDLANLRLGMALARAGDKAGATAALNAAGGAQAEIAKLWLTYRRRPRPKPPASAIGKSGRRVGWIRRPFSVPNRDG